MSDRLAHALNWTRVASPSEITAKAKKAASSKAYMAKRRAADPGFKILCSLRGRIGSAVRAYGPGTHRTGRTRELLGCTIAQLMEHITGQFKHGMKWSNYGLWHIDHIRPCASFDLRKDKEQRACFHYTNLQPLWAEDNHWKGGRWKPKVEPAA